ncbi:MAG: hypothetical protein HY321_04670 [Armatimonadetes bacterium]|nr:hypothetical protein [Armatimonadota bacterium]
MEQESRTVSTGTCLVCGAVHSKTGMGRHLIACRAKQIASAGASGARARVFHLAIEGHGDPEYWLHLEIRADASLAALDRYLREIWLECCGHLSAFEIEGRQRRMGTPVERVLRPGLRFRHAYDFGSTTHLALRVVAERESVLHGDIELLARNEPPDIRCGVCGETATQVCTACLYEPDGWLCDTCVEEHEHGEDYVLPVVNSPRVGVCGYAG